MLLVVALVAVGGQAWALSYPEGQMAVDLYRRGGNYVVRSDSGGSGSYQFERRPNQNQDIGRLVAQTTYVVPSDGRYRFTTGVKNGSAYLSIWGVGDVDQVSSGGSGSNDIVYSNPSYQGDYRAGTRVKLGFHASFGDGSDYAFAKVTVARVGDLPPATSPGGGSGGGSTGGGSPGNAAPAAAVNSGFVWGEVAQSDFGQGNYHTKTWTPSGTFIGTVYGDANLSRTSSQNSNVGIVGWRRLLVAPSAGTYTLSANASNAQIWLRINGQGVALPHTMTVVQGQQVKIDCVASFGAGWNASAGLVVGWQANVPPANTAPSAAVDAGFVWGQVAQSDYVQNNYHTKTWTPSGTFIGTAYGDASLSRTSSQNSNVGIVGWRRLLVAPADGTYSFSANASNAQVWLRINGQGVGMPHTMTVTQGQQVKIDCVAWFGSGWNASAAFSCSWQNSGSDGNPLADLDQETCDAIGAALIQATSEHQPENEEENIQPFELPQVYIDSRESAVGAWPWSGSIEADLGEKLLTPDTLKIFRLTANAKIKSDFTGRGPRTTLDTTPFDLRGRIGFEVGLKGALNWPGVVNFEKVVFRKRIAPYRNREYRIGSKITITTELSGNILGSGALVYKGPRNAGRLSFAGSIEGKGKLDVKGVFEPGFVEVRDVNLITNAVVPNSTRRHDLIKVTVGAFVGPTIGGSFGCSETWGDLANSDVYVGFNAFTLEWGGEITFHVGPFNYKYTPTWRKEYWKGTGKKVIWSTDLRQGAGMRFVQGSSG